MSYMNKNYDFQPTNLFGQTQTNNSQGLYNSPHQSYRSLFSSGSSPSNPRERFMLGKGFDIEDDMEFCPEITEKLPEESSGLKFNPYTSSTFSPKTSPQPNSSPLVKGENISSPRTMTPRTKKVLDIVNPATGMRVASPAEIK